MVEPPAPPPPPDQPPGGPPPPSGPPQEFSDMSRKVVAARGPDLILLIAGAVFLVATFLPWYRASVGPLIFSEHAWGGGGLGVLSALFGIGALVVAITAVSGSRAIGSQSAALLALVLSALALVFTFLRLVIRPKGSALAEQTFPGLDISRGIGLWLALVATIVMTFAAYQKYRENAV